MILSCNLAGSSLLCVFVFVFFVQFDIHKIVDELTLFTGLHHCPVFDPTYIEDFFVFISGQNWMVGGNAIDK